MSFWWKLPARWFVTLRIVKVVLAIWTLEFGFAMLCSALSLNGQCQIRSERTSCTRFGSPRIDLSLA
jgi:hypothetical protein